MKKSIILLALTILLALQSSAFAENSKERAAEGIEEVVQSLLNDREKIQLEYEKLYLDKILDLTSKYFGDPEGFNEFGEIYIENESEFQFVIAVSKKDKQVNSFIEEIKSVVPEKLLTVQEVKYSKNDLIAVQEDILQKIKDGNLNLSKTNLELTSSVKKQKVVLSIDQDTMALQYAHSALTEYDGIVEIQAGNINEPAKARDDEFTEMGGGLKISLSCSTTGTATKDKREFLITAGHCINNIGGTVSQGGTNIGTQHFSAYGDGGTDVGLILLTNKNKKIGNQYYYSSVANAEYDKSYTITSVALTGALICKSGYKSGVTCGTVDDSSASVSYGSITLSNVLKVYKDGGGFILGGDSGGIVFNAYANERLIGIVSGRNTSGSPEGTWGYVTKIGPALTNGGAVTLYTSSTSKSVDPEN